MKSLLTAIMACLTVFCLATVVNADISYRTGTNDAMELDFDGAGTQTSGDLGFISKSFTISGAALPGDAEFANITSITLEFIAANGTLSANNSAGTLGGGIGVASSGEGSSPTSQLTPGSGELITLNVSSTSTDPSEQVLFSGIRFSSWRNSFPVSQAEFVGATVAGNPYYIGGSGANPAVFDAPTNSFSVESVGNYAGGGGDGFRIHNISLSVSSIPEPGTFLILGVISCGLLSIRRRHA